MILLKIKINKENEISRVEECDIEKEYLKNETKSDIQEYINENEKSNKNEKINFKLNKSKSVLSMGLNRYENIDIKNSENFEPNICINNNKIFFDNNSNNNKNYESNININKIRRNNITSKENIINKSETNRTKKKRQMDNYSYYFKLKEKMQK